MKYPEIGEQVRVKNETGLHTVLHISKLIKPNNILLDDGRNVNLSNIITKHQKYVTVYVVQQHFGSHYGWEDVTQEEVQSEAILRRKEYRENTAYPTRIIRRKELNPLYQG